MATHSERSFGARLFRGRELFSYVSNFSNFNPPRPEDSLAEFKVLLDGIDVNNGSRAAAYQNYGNAIISRWRAFRLNDVSIFKLLASIRSSILANYGKGSPEFDQTVKLVQKIRGTKLVKNTDDESEDENLVSQSEQSFGSSTLYFTELVDTVGQFQNYNATTYQVSVAGLRIFLAEISTLNNQVFTSYQNLRAARKLRHRQYDELSARTQRIKAYTKSVYGTQSDEYNLIKGISI